MPYRESVLTSLWLLVPGIIGGVVIVVIALFQVVTGDGSLGERLGAASGGLIGGSVLVGALALFGRVRTEVDREALHIHLGPAGRVIPRDEIAGVEVEPYRWWRYGGWGIRIRWGGRRAYTVPFHGKGVAIATTDGHHIYVNSRQPQRLYAALLALMGQQRGIA